jgi:hypothetical protein
VSAFIATVVVVGLVFLALLVATLLAIVLGGGTPDDREVDDEGRWERDP